MAFPCPIGQIVQVLEPVLHAKLPGYPRYGFGIDPGQTWRESAMDSVKQKEQRESEAIRAALCHYEYEICRGQYPVFAALIVVSAHGSWIRMSQKF
jgi:hypothetical protein